MRSIHKHLRYFARLNVLLCITLLGCEDGGGPKKSSHTDPVVQNFGGGNGCMSTMNTGQQQQQPFQNGVQSIGLTTPLYLQSGQPTYEGQIKPILKANCFDSCHNGTRAGAPSWQGIDGTMDYITVSGKQSDIAQVVSGQKQHSEPLTLSSEQIALFGAWANAGFPKGDDLTTFQPGSSNMATNPGCVSSSGSTSVPSGHSIGKDILDQLVNSELHKECQAKSLMTDRKNNVCFADVPLEQSWCNDAGIQAKFDELAQVGQAMAAEIQKRRAEGYEIEACGVQDGTDYPHVSWIKRAPEGDKILFWVNVGKPPGE